MSWFLFCLKRVLSVFLYPLGISLFLLIAGIIVHLRKPAGRAGIALIIGGTAWLLIMSNPFVSSSMIHSLEREAGSYADPSEWAGKSIKFIVVLGGDARQGALSPWDQAACSSLLRVHEAVRLWRNLHGTTLIFSGGAYSDEFTPTAKIMANVAVELGVPKTAMIVHDKSWDTSDEAVTLAPILGKKPFVLVTTASHMLRAVMIFRREGLNPLPAPADFESTVRRPSNFWVPSATSLMQSNRAVHEYLGLGIVLIKKTVRPN